MDQLKCDTNLLLIANPDDMCIKQLTSFINEQGYCLAVESELGMAIQYAQHNSFDVIVIDTKMQGMKIDRAIRILKDLDPKVKVIVKTDTNSKELEAEIRKEKVYYYHLDSFGINDLKMAIQSALQDKTHNFSPQIRR